MKEYIVKTIDSLMAIIGMLLIAYIAYLLHDGYIKKLNYSKEIIEVKSKKDENKFIPGSQS
jgi:hypothetical protein